MDSPRPALASRIYCRADLRLATVSKADGACAPSLRAVTGGWVADQRTPEGKGLAKARTDIRRSRNFILGSLSLGHGVAHLYDQGFPVLLPTIASQMGLGTFQVSILLALRMGGFGAVNLGGGFFVDRLKRYWGLMLTWCMIGAGAAFALIGASPGFSVLLIAVLLVSVPGALWHLPATASLSQRFPDRRGFAIAIHGLGANVGNIVGPLLATGLLTVLVLWRHVLFVFAGPAVVSSLFVWWALANLGKEGDEQPRPVRTQLRGAWLAVRKPVVLGLVLAAMLRGLGLDAIFHWTPFYLEEELGKSHLDAGFHYALATGTGIVSAPILGLLSDRFGRKKVLVPGLLIAGVLSLLVVGSGSSFLLALVLAGVGLFSFALHQIFQAAVLDEVRQGTEATAIGLIFGLSAALGVASPFVGFLIIERLGGYGSVFYYSGILTLISAAVIMLIPMRGQPPVQSAPSL